VAAPGHGLASGEKYFTARHSGDKAPRYSSSGFERQATLLNLCEKIGVSSTALAPNLRGGAKLLCDLDHKIILSPDV
jgi:hypothetical protein